MSIEVIGQTSCPQCGEELAITHDDDGIYDVDEVRVKKVFDDSVAMNPRNPDTGAREDPFRTKVRDILGLSWDTRDDRIFEELRRLKNFADDLPKQMTRNV